MGNIKLSVLGTISLRKSDGSFDQSFLTGSKRLALLTYLLIARPHGYHRRDKLLTLFWPEKGQKSARNALSNMLYHLRNTLGDDVVCNRGTEEICINQDKIWCDVTAFERLLDEEKVQQALDLYRDDLLVGFHVSNISNEFQSWLDGERDRLRQRAAEGAWILAEQAEQKEDWNVAHKWASRATALTPFSEEAQRRLITLLKRMGDRAGAREAYDTYAFRLRTEWNMEPTDELKALVESMEVPVYNDGSTVSEQERDTQSTSGENPQKISSHSSGDSVSRDFGNKPGTSATVTGNSKIIRWGTVAGILIIVAAAIWAFWSGTSAGGIETPVNAERSVAVLPFTYIGAETVRTISAWV